MKEIEIKIIKSFLKYKNEKTFINKLKYFLKTNMYNHKRVIKNNNNGKVIIKNLFKHLIKDPKKYINKTMLTNNEKERAIADFIAGMTDRYAINLHTKIK